MPCMKCSNGKWKWGRRGKCVFLTKAKCEAAGRAIHAGEKAVKEFVMKTYNKCTALVKRWGEED